MEITGQTEMELGAPFGIWEQGRHLEGVGKERVGIPVPAAGGWVGTGRNRIVQSSI